MAETFNLYPVLRDEHCSALNYLPSIPEFSYTEDYEDHPLVLDDVKGDAFSWTAQLQDPRCVWYPDTHNVIIHKKCSLSNTKILFGPGGIAPHNAVIGIAENWISSKSDQRGIIPFGEITADSESAEFELEFKFEKSKIKGSLQFQTILYLKRPGIPDVNELYFASNSGTILGTLDRCEVFVDGNGSVFPIATVNEPGKPLWWVRYDDAVDPLQDGFDEENVEILLNIAHPNYEALKIGDSLKDSPLFLEVISSALMIIIDSARDSIGPDWDSVLSGQNFAPGSIAEAIYYFTNKLQWDTSSAVKLASSIRTFFDKNLQGGLL